MNIDEVKAGGSVFFPKRKSHGQDSAGLNSGRLPYVDWIPDGFRPHFVAMCGEFVGTWLFLFFALGGTQVANTTSMVGQLTQTSATGSILYISLSFGFSLAVNAWVFFRISGGLFNPAVTLGMCLVGALPPFRGVLLFIAQMLGAISSAAVVSVLFPGALAVGTTLNNGTTTAQGLFIEMFCTAELVFAIFMLAAEKHKATFIAPVGIGLALFIAELTGVYFTGGSLNPARSFAPAVVNRAFPQYHWIYWLGPILGAVLASGFYAFIKMLEYETANPGQDQDEYEAKGIDDPERDAPNQSDSRHSHNFERATGEQSRSTGSAQGSPRHQRARSANRSGHGADRISHTADRRNHIGHSSQSTGRPVQARSGDAPVTTAYDSTHPAANSQNSGPLSHAEVTAGARQVPNRYSSRPESTDTGRGSEHMWPEGHADDAGGRRVYV